MAKQFGSIQVLCLLCCFAKLITVTALTAAGKPECFQRENGALRSKTLMGRELIPAKQRVTPRTTNSKRRRFLKDYLTANNCAVQRCLAATLSQKLLLPPS